MDLENVYMLSVVSVGANKKRSPTLKAKCMNKSVIDWLTGTNSLEKKDEKKNTFSNAE